VRFPIGGLTKAEVREHARRAGLPVAEKPESMEICFVPTGDYRDLVSARAGPGRPGDIHDACGAKIGSHAGVERFTVGQRRGLPPGREARYVLSIDAERGVVVTGTRSELRAAGARLSRVSWLSRAPDPGETVSVEVKIRAQHAGAPARVRSVAGGEAEVLFEAPEIAVTPGQAAVFYHGDECLGGGWIEKPTPA
jgi:tRNA-specific 2-thiouridylase